MILARPREFGGHTYEIEAEDAKGHGSKEREGAVQLDEEDVEEGRDRGVHKDVQQNLKQPAHAEHNSHNTKDALQVEDDDSHCPSVVWIRALHTCTDAVSTMQNDAQGFGCSSISSATWA